jgi:hypothetical protein
VKPRDEWQSVLDAEAKRWSGKSCEQLISELRESLDYEVEYAGKQYQVEVVLLENTEKYVHVVVSVDDGSLPASLRPLNHGFIRHKNDFGAV